MQYQKVLRSTFAWVLYCKFAADLQNKFLEGHIWGTASVFYIICFGASNKWHILPTNFYNLQTRICRLIKSFLKVFFILWYIFRNNFSIACCDWSTYHTFISIFSQTNVVIAEASSPPQVLFKKIIWSIPAINVKKNIYFYFILFSFDQNLNSP